VTNSKHAPAQPTDSSRTHRDTPSFRATNFFVSPNIANRSGEWQNGASLRAGPLGESKQKEVRHLDIHQLDESQLAARVKQASHLPGERM
jgi:hypothetical protein